jgi:hypothetical protein
MSCQIENVGETALLTGSTPINYAKRLECGVQRRFPSRAAPE